MKSRFGLAFVLVLAWASVGWGQVVRGEPLPRKGGLGAQVAVPTEAETKAAALEANQGTKIVRVLPGLTADSLKMKEGDLLISVEGKPVQRTTVGAVLSALPAGRVISAEVWRDGKRVTLRGEHRARPQQTEDGMTVVYDQVLSLGKRIRMIATHPTKPGTKFPTVFMIGGIGAYSLDGKYDAIPYGNILGPIAKAGYAIVRIDKPGQGDSEGPAYTDLMFDDELDAYRQALRLAKTLPFVDKDRIAIFGHSMGGAFGPLLAAEESVAGVAVSGTMSKTWIEYSLENTRRQSLLAGGSAGEVDTELRQLSAVFHLMYNESLLPAQIKERNKALATVVDAMSPDGKTYSGVGIPFFQQLAQKNLIAAWQKTDAKVLALWGENDFISTEADHPFIAEVVNARKPGNGEYQRVPASDHGFNTTSSLRDSMTRWGRGGTFNSNIIEILKGWLDRTLAAR